MKTSLMSQNPKKTPKNTQKKRMLQIMKCGPTQKERNSVKQSKKLKQQSPKPHQNPQLTERPVKQRPPMTILLLLPNKKLHSVCYLHQVRFLTFLNLLSLFQYSPVNTARKYSEANSLSSTMSPKGQKDLKLHVPKNMYPTLLQTEILQEPLNVNLMVAKAHSLL